MKPDPVIERIRTIRKEISQECNHDPKVLVAHYRVMEKQFKDRILKRTLAEPTASSNLSLQRTAGNAADEFYR